MTTIASTTAWRVRELYTASDGHVSTLDEWLELTGLDALKRFVRVMSADPGVYTGKVSLHLLSPDGVDHTGYAVATLRAVQLHHAGECADACPECNGRTAYRSAPVAAGMPRSDGE